MRRSNRRRGFTIAELMIVVLVIAILAAISIPFVSHWLKIYRLGIAAQMVSDQLQATKMQAVAKTRKRELLFDVAGNRLGQEGSELVALPLGVRYGAGGVPVPPEPDVDLHTPVTFPPVGADPSLCAATFTGKGLPDADPGEVFAVYLSNDAGVRAVTMTSAGNIRVRTWTGTAWK
jgi:prepilin-type N-terminal cleavage/methylation domain-containing protein